LELRRDILNTAQRIALVFIIIGVNAFGHMALDEVRAWFFMGTICFSAWLFIREPKKCNHAEVTTVAHGYDIELPCGCFDGS
jgi:hypothetical protein